MAVYNVEKINNWLSKFSKVKTDYNDDYLKYKDTYIYTTSESTINEIKRDLNKNYDRIQRIYKNIYDQWNRYLNDLKATDNYLAGTGSAGSVKASSVSSKLSKLPKLKKYEAGTYEKLSAVNAKIGTIKTVGWTDGKTIDENLSNVMDKTGATISVAAVSVVEGVGIFAEGLVDCAALVAGGVGTALNYTYGFFANDLDSSDELNELMWKDVRAFVSKEHVKSAFDSFYEKTDVGKSMKENAIGFDTVRSVGNEVGEVVGAVTVSALTGGVVNPAVLYGASKVGNHTEGNWQDESTSTAAGLVKGVFQGVGDGVFFAIGLKGDKVMKTAVTEAVKQGGKQTFKKVTILGGKTLFECGCSVAQDGSNILINTLFSGDTVKTQDGEVVKLDTFGDKLNYYYQEAGGAQGLVTSMATAGILSFTSDYVDINKIGKNVNPNAAIKNADINTSGVKKNIGDINSKNIDVSSGGKKINPDVNIDSLKKEYNELLNKSKESWFVNAKEAGDNHWAWDLNEVDEVDKTIKRMKELEGTLGIKNTGVPESKIYDYSQAKKEADAMVQKIKNKPIPGFENIDTNSQEYKKAMQEIYSKPSPSGKQDLSQIENPFYKNNGNNVDVRNVDANNRNITDVGVERNKSTLRNKINSKIDYIKERKKIKVFADYDGDLSKYISDGMPKKLDDVSKARYIYNKLNNEVSYSAKWNSKHRVDIDETGIYNKKMNINNYNGDEIICSNWSEMYAGLLKENGIDCTIRGGSNLGNHKWVVFQSNGKYYFADATNKFDKANDLTRMQGGVQSLGFMEITKEQAFDNHFGNNIQEVLDSSKKSNLNVNKIDKKIGFNYEDAEKLFPSDLKNGNSSKELKRLGLTNSSSISEITTTKLEKNLFEKMNKMGTMEGLMYFNNRKNAIFTIDEIRNLKQKWIIDSSTGDMKVIYSVSGGKNYLYSGKNSIQTVSDDFTINYKNYGYVDY